MSFSLLHIASSETIFQWIQDTSIGDTTEFHPEGYYKSIELVLILDSSFLYVSRSFLSISSSSYFSIFFFYIPVVIPSGISFRSSVHPMGCLPPGISLVYRATFPQNFTHSSLYSSILPSSVLKP